VRLRVIPRGSRIRLRDLSRRQEHRVLVARLGAKARVRLEKADAADDFLAIEVARVPVEVAPASEAAAVGKKVAHRDLARHVGVEELEPRKVLGDPVVPSHLLLVDENSYAGGGERFRVRADGEERVFVHRSSGADLSLAESFRVDEGAVLHHRDRKAHDSKLFPDLLDRTVEVRGKRLRPQLERQEGEESEKPHDVPPV
jgi:hypothetical protein